MTIAMVLAVYWPPQAPGAGQATFSRSLKLLVGDLAGRLLAPIASIDVLDGHVAALDSGPA